MKLDIQKNRMKKAFRYLFRNSPIITVSENDGRQAGYFGGYDITTRGYLNVIIFIQKGLGRYNNLIQEIVDSVLKMQREISKEYYLLPLSFGWKEPLHHNKKYFSLGYRNDWYGREKIANEIISLAGNKMCKLPIVINKLFPKTDIRSLYHGKVGIENKDLLIYIGNKDKIYFSPNLKRKITNTLRKQSLMVQIDENMVNWIYRKGIYKFKEE